METLQEQFEAKFAKGSGCWNWTASKFRFGYGKFWAAGKTQYAHRFAYQLYVGEIQEGLCVCHKCDNPACVRPDHLFLGTKADNAHDRDNKGRGVHPAGEKHYRAKLTVAQVIDILAMCAAGVTQRGIAKQFRVSQPAISMIVCRHNWAKTGGKLK